MMPAESYLSGSGEEADRYYSNLWRASNDLLGAPKGPFGSNLWVQWWCGERPESALPRHSRAFLRRTSFHPEPTLVAAIKRQILSTGKDETDRASLLGARDCFVAALLAMTGLSLRAKRSNLVLFPPLRLMR
jgi:hypothetical protein